MSNPGEGLTTTKAPFIEQVRSEGKTFIEQPYELYSEENQETWRRLYARIRPSWEHYSHPQFLEGVEKLALPADHIPHLDEINKFLQPLSGFSARAVAGYVPAYQFFDSLRMRAFPTTITIRDGKLLDYLPEPDIFHDVAGHVPMHTDRQFADVLVRFGEVARAAAGFAAEIKDHDERMQKIESVIKAMARFFWFTIEFGLMRRPGGSSKDLCVYGSGLLSSHGEIEYCIESPRVQRYPFKLEWVINQYFEIDHYQPLLFIVDSFDHLFEQIDELERWMPEGRLCNVSPGEPAVNQDDLDSFLNAQVHDTAGA
ncbi:MAG: phenylalanine 4-monooxygenase [Planctomycetes bacterium]|nr:phenylalanine 4-monooxygenase [Planctomycetota bacterium]